jgi:Bax protein
MLRIILLALCLVQAAQAQIPNFNNYPNGPERHQAFFNYLRPLVDAQNNLILQNRKKLIGLYDLKFIKKQKLTDDQITFAQKLFSKYRISMQNNKVTWEKLLRRVDIVPVSLALAQAAIETAYGTTRFAQNANNLFGIWCYSKNCGLVPKQRPKNQHHEVRNFSSVPDSIAAYIHLLNTNSSYIILRELRAQQRHLNHYPSGMILASGLLNYSQLRETYVEAVQRLIIQYQLEKTINYSLNN